MIIHILLLLFAVNGEELRTFITERGAPRRAGGRIY